jgi:sugar lactone lactonase YvrE
MQTSIETVGSVICELGEGPVWDKARQSILWVDILKGTVHEYDTGNGIHRQIDAGEMTGAVALAPNGRLVAALHNGFAYLNHDSGEKKMLADPEAHLPGNRFNDGKCDPAGRFWAGTMSLSGEQGAGGLYMLDRNLTVTKKISGVSISNGLAWSPDASEFYYIDTPEFSVVSYAFDPESGAISDRRVAIEIPVEDGYPDGMTIDSEGMLWIAHWDGWQVTRWDPATGRKLGSINLPVARITSCCFGGAALDELYITSARTGLSENQLADQPLAGALFVARGSGHAGLPPDMFRPSVQLD